MRHDDRQVPGTGRNDTAAKRVFQAGTQRRSVANFQAAIQLARSGKLGKLKTLHASIYNPASSTIGCRPSQCLPRTWSIGTAGWGLPRGVPTIMSMSTVDGGAITTSIRGPRCTTGGPIRWIFARRPTGPTKPCPSSTSPGEHGHARYANGVKLVLDFLETPFGDRRGWFNHLGTCPVRFVGSEGWDETGDSGGIEVHPASLKEEIKSVSAKPPIVGLDVSAHARNFFDCIKTRGQTAANPKVMKNSHIACHAAALSWILKRRLTIDPIGEEFINDDEANGLRSRPARTF